MSRRALLVGINEYPDPDNRLRGCVPDVMSMRDYLVNERGWSDREIVLLVDGDATTAAIRHEALQMAAATVSGDELVHHYSGHGAQLVDGDSSSDCICPVDFDWSLERALTVQDYAAIFSQLPRDVAAVWFSDSCHSGALGGDLSKAFGVRQPRFMVPPAGVRRRDITMDHTTLAQASQALAFVSACRSDQTASDAMIGGKACGAFTHYLLETLHVQRLAELPLGTMIQTVAAMLAAAHYEQIPQVTGPLPRLQVPILAEVCV